MLLKDLLTRVSEGEAVPVTEINGRFADQWVAENLTKVSNLTVQNDFERAGCMWIFDPTVRSQREFNPVKEKY